MESVDLTTSPTVPCVNCGEKVPLSLLRGHDKCCPGGSSSGLKEKEQSYLPNTQKIPARKHEGILEASKEVHNGQFLGFM